MKDKILEFLNKSVDLPPLKIWVFIVGVIFLLLLGGTCTAKAGNTAVFEQHQCFKDLMECLIKKEELSLYYWNSVTECHDAYKLCMHRHIQ